MKAAVAFGALVLSLTHAAPTKQKRDVDTRYPYTGPEVPIGDWVDPTVNGNGKGFPRLVEFPAVWPDRWNPTNNINVISLAYVPGGINIHFQTPFGLGAVPTVRWGPVPWDLGSTATGTTSTYDRTPPCSEIFLVTQCSQFFHDVQITGLRGGETYFYQIEGANGTTTSEILAFTTALDAGDDTPFTIAVLNDMGYTNAKGTFEQLNFAADEGVAFAWHGGDISYADDWYSGVLACDLSSWDVCYDGIQSSLPPGDYPEDYNLPLPAGEIPNQGGPFGGDMSVIYESNWDLWQQWTNPLTTRIPYMVLPGNHEAACAEFDGPGNDMTAYLNDDKPNSTAPTSELTYYSCPPSQRNFTAYQNRFRMPGPESGGVGNFWYSFDYGLAHFVSIDGETDFAYSPEWPFVRDNSDGAPTESQTYVTDSGPFGAIDGEQWKENSAYQQLQWLEKDLAAVDRSKTPWIIAMTHRPMYSSEVSSYQSNVREAFEPILLKYNVDVYLSGHIHWYERLWPLNNKTIVNSNVIDSNTYLTGNGKALTHLINGMAGNIESHSTLGTEPLLNITAVLDQEHYGFSKFTFHDAQHATWEFIKGDGSGVGDTLNLVRN